MPDNTHPAVFPWHDEGVVKRTPPLALAARMACLLEYLQASAQETSRDEEPVWLVDGLVFAITGLENADRLGAVSTLLTGLETLVPPQDRSRWPLAGQIAAEHPVVAPLQEAATS